ncbi:YqeG family HAD IIIA-type phosphatase [Olsenella massiliensis]|uniref:YqeG family HAD IIIA-type phosphatase n=1 Tax=Olsenella massiliensis TaxID=1622075 RepID=UPI00071D098A|nr:YqeG family HAD IIIA-type phosphatase [Olsenella massiliensis]
MTGALTAWRYVSSIDLIDVDGLVRSGVSCVLFDRDNTCVPRDATTAPPKVVAWFDRVRAAGLSACMVSNNIHSAAVERSARELGTQVVHHAMKPLPFAVWRALALMGATREQAVLVGDQVYTDVLAGHLAGVRTILVRPQSAEDLWYTKVLRRLERHVIGDRDFEGE